jgi:twitching motility protein PilT
MNEMFKKAIEGGASDIHIKAGDFVRARLNGELVPLTEQKISHDQVR